MVLGPKLGEGAGSEAYAWGDGRIVKLFTRGTDPSVVEYEAWATNIAHQAGAPAPAVFGVVEVDGRLGIIFPRYEGETLLSMAVRGSIDPGETGAIMARLQHSLHAGQYRTPLRTFRSWALSTISELRQRGLAATVLDTVSEVLLRLPEGGTLCHGDLHPGNILMTADGPVIIDWISALNADPLVDVAREHLTLTLLFVDSGWDAQLRAADASFISTYARLARLTTDDLLAQLAPYMTVMAAMRLVESGSTERERERLLEYIGSMDSRPADIP